MTPVRAVTIPALNLAEIAERESRHTLEPAPGVRTTGAHPLAIERASSAALLARGS